MNSDILYQGNSTIKVETLPAYTQPMVIKKSAKSHPSQHSLRTLENEYQMTRALKVVEGVRQALAQKSIENQPVLILEYIEGETLQDTITAERLSLRSRLEIAVDLARILGEIHQQNVIHLDLNSKNIIIGKDQETIHLIDLGSAAYIDRSGQQRVRADQLERIFGNKEHKQAPKWRYYGAGAMVLIALAILVVGQPITEDRWAKLAPQKGIELDDRAYQIHPGELLHTMHDHKLNLVMLDLREERDYYLFHISDAENITPLEIHEMIDTLISQLANTVFVVISNDEAAATAVRKELVAESVPNVYIVEGSINNWLDTFATEFEGEFCGQVKTASNDELRYEFTAALGSGCPAAYPDIDHYEDLEYIPKIKLELKRAPSSGGCG